MLARADKYANLEEVRFAKKIVGKTEEKNEPPKKEKAKKSDPRRRSGRGEEKRYEAYTPLTLQSAELMEITAQIPEFKYPFTRGKLSKNEMLDKFCLFHNEYGHEMNQCRHLKDQIERLIQAVYLGDFMTRGGGRQKFKSVPTTDKGKRKQDTSEKENSPQKKGYIHMIFGCPGGRRIS